MALCLGSCLASYQSPKSLLIPSQLQFSFVHLYALARPEDRKRILWRNLLATHIDTYEIVVVKIMNNQTKHPQLLYEAKLYHILKRGSGILGIKWSGVDADDNVLTLDFLGQSLEVLFVHCGRRFSLKTALMLAEHEKERSLFNSSEVHAPLTFERSLIFFVDETPKIGTNGCVADHMHRWF